MLQTAVTGEQSSQLLSAQLTEAGILMGVGMLSVFLFLTLLILAMSILARIVQKFPAPEQLAPDARKSSPQTKQSSEHPSSQIVAAISAAVQHYRRGK